MSKPNAPCSIGWPLSPAEQRLWQLDQVINDRGFYCDGIPIEKAIGITAAADQAVQAELQQITGNEIISASQVEKLLAWLAARGCTVKDLKKPTLAAALRRHDLAPDVRRVIELRLEAAHASANKAASLRAWRGVDGRVRGAFKFHGAATGRWSGSGPQPQNFRRETENAAAKFAAVMTGDIETVRQLGAPIEIVGDIARAMICAPPGRRLLIGDFSGIESRVLACIAGQLDKVKQWATFDRTQDPNDDPYVVIARSLGLRDRAAGKVADLAFGYQGGLGAWKNFAPENDTATDDQIQGYKQAYRNQYQQIAQFWYGIDRAAVAAVQRAPQPIDYGRLTLQCERLGGALFLFITLPSGRRLSYPFAELMTNRFDRAAVTFMDNAIISGGWSPCNHGTGAYGGLWTENIVSGIARDLLAAAMERLEAAGYPVVLHVHDEIVCELPANEGNSLEEFKYLIEQLPDWAEGLPIAAKVRSGPRFAEIEAPVVHVAGTLETAPPVKQKAVRKASTVDLAPLPTYPPITETGFDVTDPRGRLVAWAIEREAIRLRKEAGQKPPLTTEPILAAGRFCNVYREYDRGSRWVADNIVQPHRDDPDLWFAIVAARCINEPDAIAEALLYLLPFGAVRCREVLEARQARGDKCFRTEAYKPPTPPTKGASTIPFLIDEALAPMWRDRDRLRLQSGETLDQYSTRLEACYRVGPFLAAQIIADLKHVAPLNTAADWWTFARPGPGSERGLNRIRGRPVKASWSPTHWHRELMALHAELAPLLEAAGLAPLDLQNLQNCLCEFDKWERIRDGGKIARPYKSAAEPGKRPKKRKPQEAGQAPDPIEAPAVEIPTPDPTEAPAVEIPTAESELLRVIAEDMARDAASLPPPPKPEPAKASPPPGSNGPSHHRSAGHSPHGSAGTPRGRTQTTYIYDHPDLPPPHYYLLVEKRIDAAAGKRNFYQYHWESGRWQLGVKGTYAERKVPYQLSALKAALAADPTTDVHIAEGEKDADTLRRLGFVATTNPGGAEHWSDDLTAWLRVLGVRRIVLHQDNDKAGAERTASLAPMLSSFAAVRVARYPDVPEGEDVTYWIESLGRTRAELEARITAAESANGGELDEWDAGELLSGAAPEPRQWLIARYFCRSFLSGLVAPGDAGKTTLRLTQAIELATGRALLGLSVYQRCRVLVVSFEDDRAELHRRLLAICRHHGIDPAELKGRLFCRDLNGGAKLAELDARGRRRQIGALDGMLRRAIARTQCGLVILDPFVKLHALNESDNPDMDFVCSALIRIAQDYSIAVDSPAHTHKGQTQAGDADARRGASAQRDAGRLDYTLTVMSETEAEQFGINPEERKRYMRLDKAKANIVRAVKARWFRLVSIPLGNASAVYPEGDEVQAIEPWTPPETWEGAEPETLNAILDAIAVGLPDGRRYSDHSKAKGREAWQVVQRHCPGKPEAQCREMVRQWIKAGVLVENDYDDPTARKPRKGLFLDPGTRPRY
jgi:hypothetical protein